MLRLLSLVLLAHATLLPAAQAADYRKLFERTDPSVVVINTLERRLAPSPGGGEVTLPGLGSGVLIDADGHVMTAAHVVQTADLVEVEFADGSKVTAAVVASDPIKDVALLKLDELPKKPRPAKIGDSDKVRVGEEIFIIGAPLGLAHTLTVGHVSARHTNKDGVMGEVRAETFQTDAAINQGNSGGPMFNRRGEVIGIVSHIRSRSGGSDGLGFAVTSNAAVDALFKHRMAWSGMSGITLTGRLAASLNVPQPAGYLVQKVAANSPAARFGLQPSRIPALIGGQEILIGGDIVLAMENVEFEPNMLAEFREKTTNLKPGQIITLKVLRSGQVMELRAAF